ncbi:MAG: hypothetical protein JSR44_11535 [Spirochaetes bacterium]|nr:hypothetical protein [Spirochaetota bacterium]
MKINPIYQSILIEDKIEQVQTIASGKNIHEIERLIKVYGKGRWKKQKGVAVVSIDGKRVGKCEIHWYEAHGIGKKETKIKYILE